MKNATTTKNTLQPYMIKTRIKYTNNRVAIKVNNQQP